MSNVLNTSEILGTIELREGEFELCASADATYNERSNSVVVRLEAALRPCHVTNKTKHVNASWIPKRESVTEHASIEEAGEVARDVFVRWVRKIREAAPSLHAPSF